MADVETPLMIAEDISKKSSLFYIYFGWYHQTDLLLTLPDPEELCFCLQGAVSHPVYLLDESRVLLDDGTIIHGSILPLCLVSPFIPWWVLALDSEY